MAEPRTELADNETRRTIADALERGMRNFPLTVNPAFAAMKTMLVEGSPGEVTVLFHAGVETTQGNGVVNGGALATMLDNGMAVAVLSALEPGRSCSTVSLTVNMLKPGLVGEFVVIASVVKLGGRIAFAQAQLYSAAKELVANATASLAILTVR